MNEATQSRNEVYQAIASEGLIGRMQGVILGAIVRNPGFTRAEIADLLRMQRGTVAARVRELSLMGMVETRGRRDCLITGRTTSTLYFTGRRPGQMETVTMTCPHCHGTGRVQAKVAANPNQMVSL